MTLEALIRKRMESPDYGKPATSVFGGPVTVSQEALDARFLLGELDNARASLDTANEAFDQDRQRWIAATAENKTLRAELAQLKSDAADGWCQRMEVG